MANHGGHLAFGIDQYILAYRVLDIFSLSLAPCSIIFHSEAKGLSAFDILLRKIVCKLVIFPEFWQDKQDLSTKEQKSRQSNNTTKAKDQKQKCGCLNESCLL